MRLLTFKETTALLLSSGFAHDARREDQQEVTFKIPCDTGRKTALARLLADYLSTEDSIALLITDWDIWPSSRCMLLFDAVRGGSGDLRNVEEAPGHLFTTRELEFVDALFALMLYFYWDAFATGLSGKLSIKFDHDESIAIRSNSQAILDEICSLLLARGFHEIR